MVTVSIVQSRKLMLTSDEKTGGFKKVLEGTDDLMNYISDEKLLDLVTEESDKKLVTIAQTRLQVMQGVSFVGRHAELGYEFED